MDDGFLGYYDCDQCLNDRGVLILILMDDAFLEVGERTIDAVSFKT